MNANILRYTVVVLLLAGSFSSCSQNECPKETVCDMNNPLTDLPWLKEYCENIKENQDYLSVYIYLFKVIDTGDHLFKMSISYSDFEYSPFLYSEDWRDCTGKLVFTVKSGVPPNPEVIENFMKDKEFVAELFRIVKQ